MEVIKGKESKYHEFHDVKKNIKREIKATRSVWTLDPKLYFLMRLNNGRIEAGHCTNDNELQITIYGTTSEPIAETIIREGLVSLPDHMAYLGRELKKAEIALKQGMTYVQDDPLPYEKEEVQ